MGNPPWAAGWKGWGFISRQIAITGVSFVLKAIARYPRRSGRSPCPLSQPSGIITVWLGSNAAENKNRIEKFICAVHSSLRGFLSTLNFILGVVFRYWKAIYMYFRLSFQIWDWSAVSCYRQSTKSAQSCGWASDFERKMSRVQCTKPTWCLSPGILLVRLFLDALLKTLLWIPVMIYSISNTGTFWWHGFEVDVNISSDFCLY